MSAVREVSGASTREPLVAIGMPVRNGADYITEAIESILAQTFEDFELVICDNASTDSTPEICREFAGRDERVRYLRNPRNLGAHPNFNRTFRESRGKYFKWAPHDDILHPDFLSACVTALEDCPDAVVCQTFLDYVDSEGSRIGVYDPAPRGSESENPVRRFAAVVLLPHPASEVLGLFRRSALEQSNLLQSFHGADKALLAELALRGRFLRIERPLLFVRDHKERYTRAQHTPRDRALWHDSSMTGRPTVPTWSLYRGYWLMVGCNLACSRDRWRAYSVLLAWWFRNYNAPRMFVDLLAVPFPQALRFAERGKQILLAPAPGPDEVRARSRQRCN